MLGIDLGRSEGRIAIFGASGPQIVSDADDADAFPMAVAMDREGKPRTGHAARKLLLERPEAGVEGFLGALGSKRTFTFGERTWTPTECAALYLSQLAARAESVLGAPPSRTAIAVPAYFNDVQRQAAVDAARHAGLNAVCLVNEPTAVALAWYFRHPKDRSTIAVLDLDDDAFDVTLLDIRPDRYEILSCNGGSGLSGKDLAKVAAVVDRPLQQALQDAQRTLDAVDDVVLAGGREHVAALQHFLSEHHKRSSATPEHPEQAVALGAAVYARISEALLRPPEAASAPSATAGKGCLVLLLVCFAAAGLLLGF
ncbi:MAG: Hsp70 family protein [Planctomycetes bacterium]|nr:Hsp70 family protein [Planctomycetota bacterium]